MTLEKLLDEIEEGLVIADLTLASTDYALLRRLGENPTVREARSRIAENPELAELVLRRAERILTTPAPDGYTHPRDLELSTYVFILARDPLPAVQELVSRVAHADHGVLFSSTTVARYFASLLPSTTIHQPFRSATVVRLPTAVDWEAQPDTDGRQTTNRCGTTQVSREGITTSRILAA
jgi:hypothetical protein